jgi:hypothetical protein
MSNGLHSLDVKNSGYGWRRDMLEKHSISLFTTLSAPPSLSLSWRRDLFNKKCSVLPQPSTSLSLSLYCLLSFSHA